MSLSMYQASIPVFINGLQNLSDILTTAASYAPTKKIDPSVLIQSRLAPDMFPFVRQIQITTDIIKGGAARLAGIDIPSYADTESTFSELQDRITRTIVFLETITPHQVDGTEHNDITLKVGGKELHFKGQPYLLHFVIPNFYFHITIAYAILRHNGLDIGKADYLGKI